MTITVALAGGAGLLSPAKAAGPFAGWAAVVVAGDFHDHSGGDSEAFDNARRDVARALVGAGFSPDNLRQFSVRPERYPAERVMLSEPGLIERQLSDLAAQAHDGCLVYFTSHGSPLGVVIGPRLLSPAGMARIVDDACGMRPTVVIISACFSGVFVPVLAEPDHMVLTAARPDRASFGCGSSDRYPYFDACVLETLPQGADLALLARRVQACVAAKEKAAGMAPPSEPQLFEGPEFKLVEPFYQLAAQPASGRLELSRAPGAP
ncbi:MAG: C13 family peptidase [Caulobacteraceae bacterium]